MRIMERNMETTIKVLACTKQPRANGSGPIASLHDWLPRDAVYWGYIGVTLGLHWGHIGVILGKQPTTSHPPILMQVECCLIKVLTVLNSTYMRHKLA